MLHTLTNASNLDKLRLTPLIYSHQLSCKKDPRVGEEGREKEKKEKRTLAKVGMRKTHSTATRDNHILYYNIVIHETRFKVCPTL